MSALRVLTFKIPTPVNHWIMYCKYLCLTKFRGRILLVFIKPLHRAPQVCRSGAESWAERGWGGSPVPDAALGASAQFPASESPRPPQPRAPEQFVQFRNSIGGSSWSPTTLKIIHSGALRPSARGGNLCLRSKSFTSISYKIFKNNCKLSIWI